MPDLPVTPVVVRPIQPHESRVIRRAKLMTLWTIILGVVPDIVHVIIYLLANDPHFTEWISRWLPPGLRYAAVIAIVTYAQNQIKLRKTTTAPIAGTPAAEAALPINYMQAQVAPASTQGDK